MTGRPLLTIAIPTFNRAAFLDLGLGELARGIARLQPGAVEVIVSDNASEDDTPAVLERARAALPALRAVRNATNIGSDANIAQAFNLASGSYVLILSDDDVLLEETLAELVRRLGGESFGVVCLRAYGYTADFAAEHPGGSPEPERFDRPGPFLRAIGQHITLISSLVINKDMLTGTDARDFVGGNLVQVHLALKAALRAPANLFLRRYSVACKRNNSGGYDFARVFVEELWRVFDTHAAGHLTDEERWAIQRRFLVGYYPYYVLRQALSGEDRAGALRRFDACFGSRAFYRAWLRPILSWPRPLAIAWGGVATLVGRVAGGDLRRGIGFLRDRLRA